jgi:SET domain-containing protein
MSRNLAYKRQRSEENFYGLRGADILWKPAGRKGRGVFARCDIRKGEVIEVAPVVPLAAENVPDSDPPDGYVLDWDPDTPGEEYAMALGYIMLYNHGTTPNLELESDLQEQTISAIAIRDIKAGEELTWDYGCDLWFKPKK